MPGPAMAAAGRIGRLPVFSDKRVAVADRTRAAGYLQISIVESENNAVLA